MRVHCLFDRMVLTSELREHPRNRNSHPEDQIERLAKILEFQGWRYPIKVSKRSGYITSGHGRLLAAKLMGWDQVPVNYQDYDSDEQEFADVQADNAIASWAELNLAKINDDLADLGPFDIEMLGLKSFTVETPVTEDKESSGGGGDEIMQCPKCGEQFEASSARVDG